jgi:muconate cycloisomerase
MAAVVSECPRVPSIESFQVHSVDLPFKNPFKHSAAERSASTSIFLKCSTDTGVSGFGECLPRSYVTGEDRDGAVGMLVDEILPRLVGRRFDTMEQVLDFLETCDGKAPGDWVARHRPQGAAWSAVDLALLDTFGRALGERALEAERRALPSGFRYSGALSSTGGWPLVRSALKQRLFGIRQTKLKVERTGAADTVCTARRVLGSGVEVRVDANMAWSVDEAVDAMRALRALGVASVEQPVAADDTAGLARLVAETGVGVMVDESFTDRASLERLIELRACTAINARISKCGGLVATLARCREALAAGLTVQIGCQVGENSLLSSAHLALVSMVQRVTYAEGCFGPFLLRGDPVSPLLQFARGGRPPAIPTGSGLGISVDEQARARWTVRSETVPAA